MAKCNRLSGDQQIIAADRLISLFEAGAEQAVGGVGWRLEGHDVECAEHRFKLSREPWRRLFRGPVPQFRRDDDAGTDPRFADLADVLRHTALWVANEVGELAQGITLGAALNTYLIARKTLRPKTARDYRLSLERYLPGWLEKPLKDITPDMVEARHRGIQEEVAQRGKTSIAKGHSAANSTMRVLRVLWNYAKERNPDLPDKPVNRLRRAWYPEERREGCVKATDLPTFHKAVLGLQNTVHRDYLLLVLFTGLRRNEAATLRWADVDLQERMISLPAKRTKAGRKLDLPLSDYLHDLLTARRAIGRDGPYVFSADSKSGHLEEPQFALRRIKEATGIKVTVHDLRRTFVTVAESCDIPVYALKGLVNHSMGTDVTAGYVVAGPDRLRAPMQKVTDKFKELIGLAEPGGDNVVRLGEK